MRKQTKFFMLFALLFMAIGVFAQERYVAGVVTDELGDPVVAATVRVAGTDIGAVTDLEGKFSLNVPDDAETLSVSFVGMQTKIIPIVTDSEMLVTLISNDTALQGVVVTALGINREKKQLGYATQEVGGDDIADVKSTNFADALSGEVAGLEIQSYNQMGGSANIVTRGYSSLTQSNQALIVIDGTPIINSTGNTGDQQTGRGGYDYGNAAMDINPDDIASVNVLKGAAATALYGSRAGNGAIIITTKKGSKTKGLGVSVNSSFMVGSPDEETLPKYQKKYGAGYGPFYEGGPDGRFDLVSIENGELNLDGEDVLVAVSYEDASYGGAFDSNLNVLNWWNLIPGYGNYLQPEPYTYSGGDANDFLKNSNTFNNSVSLTGGSGVTSYRLNFTNVHQEGILPNSKIDRNNLTFSGGHKFTDKFDASTSISYSKTDGLGRYGTGYSNRNTFQAFRQWWDVNGNLDKQKDVYEQTGQNYSWNMLQLYKPSDFYSPHYTDNPYWMRDNAYNTDVRNRIFGNITANYAITNDLSLTGRVSLDSYNELREERINVGSADVAMYSMMDQNRAERNFDLIGSFSKELSEDIDVDANLGWNLRVEDRNFIDQVTNGGLNAPGLYNFDNSVNAITPEDVVLYDATKKVDGQYGRLSFGFFDTYFIEGTGRFDRSSALPVDNNRYFYPSVSGSVIVSNIIDRDWLEFAKLRANYAEVGNDVSPYRVFPSYSVGAGFGGVSTATNPSAFNNPNLKSERHKEIEVGLEMSMLDDRLGFDVSFYNRESEDLITDMDVPTASGASRIWLNGGSIENRGVELITSITPVKTDDLRWDVKVNFTRNRSEVLDLADELEYYNLASLQGGVSIGAKIGEAFGIIRGRDFVYNEATGQREVYTADDAPSGSWVGMYKRTSSTDNVIGDMNPDWTGGVKNKLSYKNFDLSFLVDVQKGGDVFSLDTYYGYATGLYDFTAGTNDLGNPVRDPITDGADSGGIILEGVNADGTPNETRAYAGWYANPWGYARSPTAAHVYDASFVKLREVKLGYDLPEKFISNLGVQGANIAFIARNPWIIHKNTPYTDPEAGLSAGNVQGYQSGAYPSVKEFGVNLGFKF